MPLPLPDEKEVPEAVNYMPRISIILPFEPKMTSKRELEYKLQRIADQVEKYLARNYVDETVTMMMDKLNGLIKSLDFSTYKKSLAIFLSPIMEKVYYLDIPVEEKLIIDESFEIRDLVYNKKDLHTYLVLVLSSARSRLFLGKADHFLRLASYTPAQFAGCRYEASERLSNFSDPSPYKEVMLEKFLRYADNSLGIILKAYQLPLFVMATEKVTGMFKKITQYSHRITGYVPGNFEEATEAEIWMAIEPQVADWKKIKTADLLLRLDAARGSGKLAMGIQKVWQAAAEKKGRLLVVEKNYMFSADRGASDTLILPHDEESNSAFYIKDAVDDVIEKVLENGGDVEFVEDDALADYAHIALILYY
jgi:hypothetical protein